MLHSQTIDIFHLQILEQTTILRVLVEINTYYTYYTMGSLTPDVFRIFHYIQRFLSAVSKPATPSFLNEGKNNEFVEIIHYD